MEKWLDQQARLSAVEQEPFYATRHIIIIKKITDSLHQASRVFLFTFTSPSISIFATQRDCL